MRCIATFLFAPLFALSLASPPSDLAAQDSIPEVADFAVPLHLAEREVERSRACVPVLGRVEALEAALDPLSRRVERLRALDAAVAVEDSLRVAPFDETDPVEVAVREWFDLDAELARRQLDEGEDAVAAERRSERAGIRTRLQQTFAELDERASEMLEAEGGLEDDLRRCDGAIFVRSVVVEACGGESSRFCDAAREADPDAFGTGQNGPFRFMGTPEAIWGLEHLRPWTEPTELQLTPSGLAGARSAALTRRGNVTVVLGVAPLIRERASVGESQATELEAHVASLGFEFEHPGFFFTPALQVDVEISGPLDRENAYLLHFGDLSDPEDQIIWSTPATGGPIQELLAVDGEVLTRLAGGEDVSFTAIRAPEDEETEGQAIFSLTVPTVNQASALSALLEYMRDGGLSADLVRILPPEGEGTEG